MINIQFNTKNTLENQAIVVLINDQLKMDKETLAIDKKYNDIISNLIKDENKFKGKMGQSLLINSNDADGNYRPIIVLGIGDESKLEKFNLEDIGGHVYNQMKAAKLENAGIEILNRIGKFSSTDAASHIACGSILASYKFDKYMTKLSDAEKWTPSELNINSSDKKAAEKSFEQQKAIIDGVFFARDLVSEVPNILCPESYAEKILKNLEPLGVDVEVLGEREMRDLGMGALLGVGQGSQKESKMVVMKYMGGASDQKPVCFVGKGVTFDTGGISLKPSLNMHDMKYDMGGSASVVGAMKAIAGRSAKVNAVGIVGLVENMPGGGAQRPGDVVKTMSGQTVEVLNTDAEGRLVLCDCVTYLQEKFDPECIIDLATLTGAIVVSLASTYAGLFANDDDLADKLMKSSKESNEGLWRMPLHKEYDDMIKSTVADVANIGGRGAGSSTAAHFIGRFIKDGMKWAHLDIAGMAWESKGKATCPKGGVGFGVKLLDQFVSDNYESK